MKFETRRVFDFIMGGCSGFCFFYGGFIGYSMGALMFVSFIIKVLRPILLEKLEEQIKMDEETE